MGNSALRPIHNQSNIIHTKFILRKKRDKSKTNRICKNRTELRKRLERSRGALGSDAAIEASDVVIRDDSLEKVSEAKHLSKKTRRVRIFGIILSIGLKVLRMILVLTGVRGRYARIVAGVSDTGVRIISVLNALRMLFYKPKYLKQNKEKQTQPMLSSAD